METGAAAEHCDRVLAAVADCVVADEDFLEAVLTGILARGGILLEDVPGTGKTLTAKTVASRWVVPPRGMQRLLEAVRGRAVLAGRDYVRPSDVTDMAQTVLALRLDLTADASVDGVTGRDVVGDVLDREPVPTVASDDPPPVDID